MYKARSLCEPFDTDKPFSTAMQERSEARAVLSPKSAARPGPGGGEGNISKRRALM